MRIQHNRI